MRTGRTYDKLVTALRDAGYTCGDTAKVLLITAQTFSEKVHGKSPWTLDEMYTMLGLMDCGPEAMAHYFPDRRRISA